MPETGTYGSVRAAGAGGAPRLLGLCQMMSHKLCDSFQGSKKELSSRFDLRPQAIPSQLDLRGLPLDVDVYGRAPGKGPSPPGQILSRWVTARCLMK
jgi:hypothetical protein